MSTDAPVLSAETTMATNNVDDDITTTKSDGIKFPERVTVQPFNPFAGTKINRGT